MLYMLYLFYWNTEHYIFSGRPGPPHTIVSRYEVSLQIDFSSAFAFNESLLAHSKQWPTQSVCSKYFPQSLAGTSKALGAFHFKDRLKWRACSDNQDWHWRHRILRNGYVNCKSKDNRVWSTSFCRIGRSWGNVWFCLCVVICRGVVPIPE